MLTIRFHRIRNFHFYKYTLSLLRLLFCDPEGGKKYLE